MHKNARRAFYTKVIQPRTTVNRIKLKSAKILFYCSLQKQKYYCPWISSTDNWGSPFFCPKDDKNENTVWMLATFMKVIHLYLPPSLLMHRGLWLKSSHYSFSYITRCSLVCWSCIIFTIGEHSKVSYVSMKNIGYMIWKVMTCSAPKCQ